MAKRLNGNALSDELNEELKMEIDQWTSKEKRRKPCLACILVGDDPASAIYVSKKIKTGEAVGIHCILIKFDDNIMQDELLHEIEKLNKSNDVDGVLVQLPLPISIDERTICNAVNPMKDVDGFHIENVGKLCLDMESMLPCTAIGVLEIIKRNKIETFGRNIVVAGRSKNVGMPIAMLLHSDGTHESKLGMDATVTICHRHTPAEQLGMHCRNADIIISAAGVPNLIKASMVKPGAVVIDVGLSRVKCPETGKVKIVGDVDFEEVSKIASAITPVPGGVGPMTVAMLMSNTFKAAKKLASML